MSDSTLCSRIILCGPSAGTLPILATLLRSSATTPVEVTRKSAFAAPIQPGLTVVTTAASDALGLKRMAAWPAEEQETARVIICTRDPRDLLRERSEAAGGDYRIGFDHSLHVSGGFATLTAPGLLFTHEVSENWAKRDARVLLLRHEDLLRRPRLVQLALSRFTGLDFEKPFAALLSAMSPHADSFLSQAANGTLSREDAARIARQFRLAPELFDLLWRMDYEGRDDRAWYDALLAEAPGAMDDTPGTIIGFHTPDPLYRAEAERMRRSIEALRLPLDLTMLASEKGWLSAVQRKPRFLLEQRRRTRGPLLYVDVDAVVHSDPWPYLRGYGGDVAVAGHHGEAVISGTILLNDTPGALAVLEEWTSLQDASPELWDQQCLETLVKRRLSQTCGVRIQFLPPEMCCVFNRKFNPPITPVIEHLQASREQFAHSSDTDRLTNLAVRRARLSELDTDTALVAEPTDPAPAYADRSASDRSASTRRLIKSNASDVSRWSDHANLKSTWRTRAAIVAGLVTPGSRVLDLGCGAMDLEQELPDGAVYLPADLVARDSRTIMVDLNAGQLPDVDADVITMLGVLEYVHNPGQLFGGLAQRWPRLVVTYNPTDLDGGRDRHAHGWFSALTSAGLVSVAEAAGYRLEAIIPHGQRERVYDLTVCEEKR